MSYPHIINEPKANQLNRWMSKEPAEIFEAAAEEGFITQLKHHSSVSQYGQLSGADKLDGSAVRSHFKDILYNQVSSLTIVLSRVCTHHPVWPRFSTESSNGSSLSLKRTLRRMATRTQSMHYTLKRRIAKWVKLRRQSGRAWPASYSFSYDACTCIE